MKRPWPLALWLACCASPSAPPPEASSAPATPLLSPSLRRLSVAELSAAASSLVGATVELSPQLPPDARAHDFSRNLIQSVDALTLKRLASAGRDVAERLDLSSASFVACAASAQTGDRACRAELVEQLASRAFRRTPSQAELTSLGAIFDAGAASGTFRDGAVLVVRALLGSPELIYETAFGASVSGSRLALSDDELGNQLSWLIAGVPPDSELRRAASAGELRSGKARRQQAERLLGEPAARPLYRRFVEEWLGLHRVRSLAKSSAVLPDFARLREPMLRETEAVIDDVLSTSGGSLAQLFGGSYSLVPPELAALYGIVAPPPGQRVSLAKLGRVGILQQASFLASFAHEDGSAPVLRGKAVLERLLCRELPKPSELGIELVLPPPNPEATTRERFALHAEQPRCAGCHDLLDGVGFSFENFDAVGRLRATEAGKPIDTSGHVTIDGREVALGSSLDLSLSLAGSEELGACAARQVVRFAAGAEAGALEDEFVRRTRELSASERGSLFGLFLAYVEGDWFAWRAAP
jgi:hypothetical protein